MYFLDTKILPTVGGTKTAKPLIFLATIGITFNRHLVDIARVVSPQSSAYIAFSSVYGVYDESAGLLEIFRVLLPAATSSSPSTPVRRFALESKTGQAAPGSGRRFKQSKRKRAREEKKRRARGIPPLWPFRFVSPWYIEISPSRCWPKFRWSRPEKDSTRARTIMWEEVDGANPSRHEGEPWAGLVIDVFSIPRQSDIIRV